MQTLAQLHSGELKGIKKLKLSSHLSTFPKEILELSDTLEILDLSGNQLAILPEDFGKLSKLKIAFFSDNKFTSFPKVLANCENLEIVAFKANAISEMEENVFPPKLRWLILTNNKLKALPKTIGDCKKLEKLMLAGNEITDIPAEIQNCLNLRLLRISANNLTIFPEVITKLNSLAWVAFAGNPFNTADSLSIEMPKINWNELLIEEKLGEGASGIISKINWVRENRDYALKVFKGSITSDGLPADEMKAYILAGRHENLTSVIGQLSHHPQQNDGILMELLPKTYTNLGNPPDFNTCTRDIFSKEAFFTIQQIMKIALSMASTAAHLHAKGISHGDFYAHNILINEKSHAILGDFGAASIYDRNADWAVEIEKIEVRAFGYLLDDLLTRIEPSDAENPIFADLSMLKNDCLTEKIVGRPSFDGICEALVMKDKK